MEDTVYDEVGFQSSVVRRNFQTLYLGDDATPKDVIQDAPRDEIRVGGVGTLGFAESDDVPTTLLAICVHRDRDHIPQVIGRIYSSAFLLEKKVAEFGKRFQQRHQVAPRRRGPGFVHVPDQHCLDDIANVIFDKDAG
jgi:hypothetical protein